MTPDHRALIKKTWNSVLPISDLAAFLKVLQAYSGEETQTVRTGTIKRLLHRYLEHLNKRRAELKSLDPRIHKDRAIDRSEVTSIVYADPKGRRRGCAENKIVAPYEGRRWCDATERELIGDITNGHRSSF